MFVDEVEIFVEAGNGGNGMTTFRKEKYVPRGGPNGGDGGHGGSVLVVVDSNLNTLVDLRNRHRYRADRGGDGATNDMFGRNGGDLMLKVPPGTVITDADTGEVIADLDQPDAKAVLAHGGIGGRGNAHFATSTHQAPMFAEKGEPGEKRRLKIELKLLADVGLLGFPNVGKSTIIAAVSAARPKIANYPFTTLVPNLGVVSVEVGRSFVMADIPGIIEGASEGIGLGHQFLRHVERTRLLVHVLDAGGLSGRDPLEDFHTLNRELALYSERLSKVQQVVALNKTDITGDSIDLQTLQQEIEKLGFQVYVISAATRAGLRKLVFDVMVHLENTKATEAAHDDGAVRITAGVAEPDLRRWTARQTEDGTFEVVGKGIDRLIAMTDLENEYAVRRLQRILDKMGITGKLRALGAVHGSTVRAGNVEFDFDEPKDAPREEEPDDVVGPRRRRIADA